MLINLRVGTLVVVVDALVLAVVGVVVLVVVVEAFVVAWIELVDIGKHWK